MKTHNREIQKEGTKWKQKKKSVYNNRSVPPLTNESRAKAKFSIGILFAIKN